MSDHSIPTEKCFLGASQQKFNPVPPASCDASSRRSWRRPHASAFFAGLGTAILLCLLNTAGRQQTDLQWHFGWPWEYVECYPHLEDQMRQVNNSFDTVPFGWRRSFLWRDGQIHGQIAPWWAFLDAVACVVVSLIIAGLVEWWRRQRHRVWQIHLREVLGACALLGMAFAAGTHLAEQARVTGKSVARLKSHTSKGGGIGIDYGLPAIVRENLPDSNFQPFDRIVYASGGIRSEFDDEDLRFLATQPYLRSVEMRAAPGCGAALEACSNLSSVFLLNGYMGDQDFLSISRIKGLKRLRVYCSLLPPETFSACAAMSSLKELTINGRLLAIRTKDGKIIDYPTSKLLSDDDLQRVEDFAADLTLLQRLRRLESLELGRLELKSDSLAALANVKSLKSLRVGDCKYDPLDLENLRRLRPDMTIDAAY